VNNKVESKMIDSEKATLKNLIFHPNKNIKNASGWQRLWIFYVGILLLIHIISFLVFMPNGSVIRPDTKLFQKEANDASYWLGNNKEQCKRVLAIAENEKQIAIKKENDLRELLNESNRKLLIKIKEAEESLFLIEISGGKYFSEWAKVKNKIEAFNKKYAEQRVEKINVNYLSTMSNSDLGLIVDCEKYSSKRDEALEKIAFIDRSLKQIREDFIYLMLYSFISFVSLSFGIYGVFWSIGWIRRGFVKR
jgi:hypothetical protein